MNGHFSLHVYQQGAQYSGSQGARGFAPGALRIARWCCLAAATLAAPGLSAQQLEWTRQFTGNGDGAWDLATAADGVYVLSADDSRLFKFDAAGNQLWSTPPIVGTNIFVNGFTVDFDPRENALYTGGAVVGALPGQAAQGLADAYVRKYDTDGNEIWTRQFGTASGEAVFDIATDASGVYVLVSGALPYTYPPPAISVRKFDHLGNPVWTQTLGGVEDLAYGLAVSGNAVYVTGVFGRTAALWSLNLNGGIRWQRSLELGTTFGDDAGRDVVVHDGGSVYVTGIAGTTSFGNTFTSYWRYGPGTAFLAKFDSSGNQIWTVPAFDTGNDVGEGLAVDAGGTVSVAGSIHTGAVPEAAVARFDSDGKPLWTEQFNDGTDTLDEAHAVATRDGEVYVAGRTGATFSSSVAVRALLAKFVAAGHPLVRCLGDVNGDKVTDLALILPTGRVLIKDLDGMPVNRFAFTAITQVTDVEVMPDIDGNGAPELVALGRTGRPQAEVRDALTGAYRSRVFLDPAVVPVDLELVDDQTGNGVSELAALGRGSTQVDVFDALTAQRVNRVGFSDGYEAKDLAVYPDLDGNGSPELSALDDSENPAAGDKIEVRDLATGNLVQNIWLGTGWRVLRQALLADRNGNGAAEVAVLRVRDSDGAVNVLMRDTATRKALGSLGFDRNYPPSQFLALADMNGNGADEVVVFGTRFDGRNQKAQIKDSKSGALISRVFFDRNFPGEDMTTCSDIDGNGADELVLLGRRARDGQLKAMVQDARTGASLGAVRF